MPTDDTPPDDMAEDGFSDFEESETRSPSQSNRPPSLWRFEILQRGDETHAADAIEIVAGDIVRRVSLTAIDYSVIHQRNLWVTSQDDNIDQKGRAKTEPTPADLAPLCDLDEETISAAQRRLAVIGLLPPPQENKRVQ